MKYLIALILIVGCEPPKETPNELREKAKTLICTGKQLELVKAEFDICNRSGYFSTHCFDVAKVAHCKESK